MIFVNFLFFLIPLATDFLSLDNFQNFIHFGFYVTLWLKISVTKFWKSKIWDDSFQGFSVSFVLMYFIFSVDAVFMEKFTKQNGHFSYFLKNLKKTSFEWLISPPRRCQNNFPTSSSSSSVQEDHFGPPNFYQGLKWVISSHDTQVPIRKQKFPFNALPFPFCEI